jgi:RNA polymerase sigma-70 factor (ECF subfamily)
MAFVSVEPSTEFFAASNRIPVFCPAMDECGNIIPDEELVKRSLKGEEDAFRRLYERYRRPIYAAVCRIILDPEEARDATQEIFITIYRSLALWSPRRARFSPWIYRVATNRAIDHWRIRRRRAELQLTESSQTQSTSASFCWGRIRPVDGALEQKERAAEVRHFLKELPQPQRRFFVLRYCDGLKLREIAEQEGYKLGTVKSSLHRATKIMRRKLKRLYNRHSSDHS